MSAVNKATGGRPQRSEDSERQNRRDEAVARDPDIAGVSRRGDRGAHIQRDDPEFRASGRKR